MIPSRWVFCDYVDELGFNAIQDWISGIPKKARQRMVVQLQYLESTPKLVRPYVALLKHECDGLIEIRFQVAGVQYRPLACYGPGNRTVTLLIGATKKSVGKNNVSTFDPTNACAVGLRRKKIVLIDQNRTVPHDYNTT